jgi:hypothetical protein
LRTIERATLDAVAKRFSGRWIQGTGAAEAHLEIAGKRIAICIATIKGAEEPRLRFDRVALGFVRRLRAALAKSVPAGKVVVATTTAPIWQASKTAAVLQEEIRRLLAARLAEIEVTIERNRIRVRVLKGGAGTTPKLLGFVHNPDPGPAVLFGLTHSLLACMSPGKSPSAKFKNDRWLVIANEGALAPLETVRHVCSALRVRTVFKKILVADSDGKITLLKR